MGIFYRQIILYIQNTQACALVACVRCFFELLTECDQLPSQPLGAGVRLDIHLPARGGPVLRRFQREMGSDPECSWALRLHREPFWKLAPPPGREITGPVIDSIATIAQLQSCFSGIAVDPLVAHTVSLPEK